MDLLYKVEQEHSKNRERELQDRKRSRDEDIAWRRAVEENNDRRHQKTSRIAFVAAVVAVVAAIAAILTLFA